MAHMIIIFQTVKIKDCNFMLIEKISKNVFDQPIKCNIKTYQNIRKFLLVEKMIKQLFVY